MQYNEVANAMDPSKSDQEREHGKHVTEQTSCSHGLGLNRSMQQIRL